MSNRLWLLRISNVERKGCPQTRILIELNIGMVKTRISNPAIRFFSFLNLLEITSREPKKMANTKPIIFITAAIYTLLIQASNLIYN